MLGFALILSGVWCMLSVNVALGIVLVILGIESKI